MQWVFHRHMGCVIEIHVCAVLIVHAIVFAHDIIYRWPFISERYMSKDDGVAEVYAIQVIIDQAQTLGMDAFELAICQHQIAIHLEGITTEEYLAIMSQQADIKSAVQLQPGISPQDDYLL